MGKSETIPNATPSLISRTVSVYVKHHVYLLTNFTTTEFRSCVSRGGRPGLPSLISLMVPVDVKQH